MNLKSMAIGKLLDLKHRVETALNTRIAERRRVLESDLAKLSRVGAPRGRGGSTGKIAPKYRNPANPGETWAGRGLKPRWLAAAIKSGKKLEHFAIAAPAKTAAVKRTRGKTRKARN
jgi:DNA-binding protein H-NS